MLPLRVVAFATLVLLGSVPVQVGAQPAGMDYEMILSCPGVGVQVSTSQSSAQDPCPIRVPDGDDLMGDPSIAVDPLQPENYILGSLHGCARDATCALGGSCPEKTPTPRARCNQVFTTFTSQNSGASWVDTPYNPPEDIGSGAFGMHPQVTIDPYGQVYVGSLYARPTVFSANTTAGASDYEYIIGAQKFESIQTIIEEQGISNGGYNAEYITPVYVTNQINQMWFLFNPVTDNMTMVWHESVPRPIEPPCETDSAYLVDAGGNYVRASALTQQAEVYQESNGIPDLQSEVSCPTNPDNRMVFAPATAAQAVHATQQAAPPAAPSLTATTLGLGSEARSPSQHLTASNAPAKAAPAPLMPAAAEPTPRAQPEDADDDEEKAVGAIGIVWTTADSDTPYYYQDLDDAIQPCSGSTNPVLSYGWLYVGCVVDTSEGVFRWAPEARNGTVHLFRMDPNGGTPEYMGQAPDMAGIPKLGVRSDGRLVLIASGASKEGALLLSAAFGQYDPLVQKITWGKELSLGQDILRLDPDRLIVNAAVQDVVYREESGAVHVIIKTTVNYLGGVEDVQDGLSLLPHIQKMVVALDEQYGILDILPLVIGDPAQRNQDATIAATPEAAFQDLSDDLMMLPAEPYTFQGKFMGEKYQREFFAIADYGTVLFAEIIENTTLKAPASTVPVPPPAPTPAPAATNLVAPVAGLVGSGALMGTLVAHRRKNPLAAFTKGE